MDNVGKLEAKLSEARESAAEQKAAINKRQQARAKLREEIRALSPDYAFAVADVNALEKELSALKNPGGAAQVIAVDTAREKDKN